MDDNWSSNWMSLGWLRCLVCVVLIHTSFQYGGEGPDGSYSATANFSSNVKPYPNNCACHDRDGRIYNLEPLQNTNGTASFTVKGKKYSGYSYAYNPCSSFKLGTDGGCQSDVAICWYAPGFPESYKTIGNQGRAGCKLDKESKIPILVYNSSKYPHRKATVKLKCDERKKGKGEAIFEVLDEDKWTFHVTHLCACGDGCLINPVKPTTADVTTPPDPFDPMTVVTPVAATAGTLAFFFVPYLVWRLVGRQNNNNNHERRHLLGNEAVDPVNYPIQESSAGRSQPVPTCQCITCQS